MNKPFNPPNQVLKIIAAQLRRYADLYQVIPLHRPTDTRTNKKGVVRKVGKAPLDLGWTKVQYNTAKIIDRCIREGRNAGIRLRDDQLVIDVDPRNGGTEGLKKLAHDFGLGLKIFPRVVTGSGGYHLYCKKNPGVRVVDTLENYPGVEFKSTGRQVVSAGSIHPDTLKPYLFDDKYPPLSEAPQVPANLLNAIARPDLSAETSGGGELDQEQVAEKLAFLDPTEFGHNDTWVKVMMATHHASAGDGRQEFIEWSIGDPKYADDAEIIGRRWDSLSREKPGAITVRTLNKLLIDAGHPEQVARIDAADDFETEDDDEFEGKDSDGNSDEFEGDETEEPSDACAWMEGDTDQEKLELSWLEALNEKYCAITTGGKYRITYRTDNGKDPTWESMNKFDFQSLYENKTVLNPRDPKKRISLGVAWQTWPHRLTATGVTFNTDLPAGVLDEAGNLNLWLGWAIEPKQGKWTLFRKMIEQDIADGDSVAAKYILNWLAWKFQHPGELPQTAIAMRGKKGTGKGTLGQAVADCYGSHALCTSKMEHVAGRFNGHMEHVCFLYADEAFWSGDHRYEATVKATITDKRTTYEHKNIPAYTGINHIGMIFASNDDWIVPATEGERRYCVVRTSEKNMCPEGEPNHKNRPYWDAIHDELNNGGLAAFLFDMLRWKLPDGWHARGHIPMTQELANQKAKGFKEIVGYYFELLQTGAVFELVGGTNDDWEKGPLYVRPTEFWDACKGWVHVTNRHANITRKELGEELKRFGWEIGDHQRIGKKRDRYWLCPGLTDARAQFNSIMKGEFFASEADA